MAVTKIWAIHDSVSRVVDYCSNPEKTRLTDLEQVLIYASLVLTVYSLCDYIFHNKDVLKEA